MHVSANDPMVQEITAKTFPDYKGKKFCIEVRETPINCASYWDSGHRDYFRFICLQTMKASDEMPAQSAYDPKVQGIDSISLVPDIACVVRSFHGMHESVTIYIHPDNAAKLLPKSNVELSRDETIVLVATRSLKSSYAGISNYRLHAAREQTGITSDRWENAKTNLIQRKYLDKRGAITIDGKNALETKGYLQLHNLRQE